LNDADFARSIARLWEILRVIGLDESFSNPASLKGSSEFLAVVFDPTARYEDVFLAAMRNSDYNIMLRDYAFFQFSLGNGGWRLAYYPNPFLGASQERLHEVAELKEYVDEGVISVEDLLQSISELRSPKQAPLLRYEWAPDDYVKLAHPSSHLHVGFHSDNRWMIDRLLSPEAFGFFVLKLYYGDQWDTTLAIRRGLVDLSLDEIYSRSKLAMPLVPDTHISLDEKRQFFLS
jgi:hypothetical protein